MAGAATENTADITSELRELLQEHDLSTLSERKVRELMVERHSWSAEELQGYKPLIKALYLILCHFLPGLAAKQSCKARIQNGDSVLALVKHLAFL